MQAFLGELVFHPSPQTAEQVCVGWDEKHAPLKTPAWEATLRYTVIRKLQSQVKSKDFTLSSRLLRISHFMKKFSYFTRKSKSNHRTINRQFEFARTKSYSMTCFFLKRRNLEFRVLVYVTAVACKPLACSQTLYFHFKVRQARVIKYKPQGIY